MLSIGETERVPKRVTPCPECGGRLQVTSRGTDIDSGRPISEALDIECENETIRTHHYRQSDWDGAIGAIRWFVGSVSDVR